MEQARAAHDSLAYQDALAALAGGAEEQIRLLKQVVPGLERVAILGDAGVPDLLNRANVAACEAEGIRPQLLLLRGAAEDLDAVFAAIQAERAQAVLGLYVPTVVVLHARPLVAMATAFGSSIVDGARLMARQADRVLRGAKPGDLPVEVVTRHRLTVNRRVEREIGVTVPPDVLARADQVIG